MNSIQLQIPVADAHRVFDGGTMTMNEFFYGRDQPGCPEQEALKVETRIQSGRE